MKKSENILKMRIKELEQMVVDLNTDLIVNMKIKFDNLQKNLCENCAKKIK